LRPLGAQKLRRITS